MITTREFEAGDAPALRGVFHSAIHGTARRDYSQPQVEAWAPREYDVAEWAGKLRRLAPFVALLDGIVAGYADVQRSGEIDHFYVAATAGGQGVGAALMRRLFARAGAWQLTQLSSQVSLTAQPFFVHFGFELVEHRVVEVRGVALRNAAMRRCLR